MRFKYAKLLANLGNAVDALCPPGPAAAEVTALAKGEGRVALTAAGIEFVAEEVNDVQARWARLEVQPIEGRPRAGSSTRQSLVRGTPTIETDYLNGEISLLGRLHGVPTPINDALCELSDRHVRERRGPGTLPAEEVLARVRAGHYVDGPVRRRGRRRDRCPRCGASSRHWSRSPRPRATWTAPRRRPRCVPRCCRPRPPSSAAVLDARGRARPVARIGGTAPRALLLGHVDTVIAHEAHGPMRRDGERLYGPGTADMKGGVVLALGVARALAGRAGLRRAPPAAGHRRGVAHGPVRPRGAVRRLRRLPVLRGRRADARARRGSSCAARPPERCASPSGARLLRLGARPRRNALLGLAGLAGELAGGTTHGRTA